MIRTAALVVAWIAAGGILSAGAAPAPLLFGTLRVTVEGVTGAGGTLRIGLHDEATFPDTRALPLRKTDLPKIAGDVSVVFDNLPPGDYALHAFQDVNDNGRWDTGEPEANSNGAAAGDFAKAAIEVAPGTAMTVVHLK